MDFINEFIQEQYQTNAKKEQKHNNRVFSGLK